MRPIQLFYLMVMSVTLGFGCSRISVEDKSAADPVNSLSGPDSSGSGSPSANSAGTLDDGGSGSGGSAGAGTGSGIGSGSAGSGALGGSGSSSSGPAINVVNSGGPTNQNLADFTNTLNVVEQKCAAGNVQNLTYDLDFPNPNIENPFALPGNGPRNDRFFMARVDQLQKVPLPQNGTLCGFQVAVQTSNNKFVYDDHFLFAIDNTPVAYSYRFDKVLPRGVFGVEFDWSKIMGKPWLTSEEGIFCLGMESGLAECSWPQTDTKGEIILKFKNELIQKVFALRKESNRSDLQLRFISFGDNDDYDCEHSDIKMKVTVQIAK